MYLNHSDIKYNRQEDKGGMLVFVSFFETLYSFFYFF